MQKANSEKDINWRNMGEGGGKSGYVVRRFFLNIAAILILIFFSTPAVIFSAIEIMISKDE